MPLTFTLTCAFCGKQEKENQRLPAEFPGWYAVVPAAGSIYPRVIVCGEECLASWAMRQQLEKEGTIQ